MDPFYSKLAEILEVEEVGENSQLDTFPAWDSLGVLSVIAMIDSQYGVNLTSLDLVEIKTPGGLLKLVLARKGG
ncbi:MAG: acyl carrier protein [Deltaproteobacteria bacterium]|nr:acyl carrier protein [Deltaproteobacteria bacterium]